MKDKSFSIWKLIHVLTQGIALAACIEGKAWTAAAVIAGYIGVLFFRSVPDKWTVIKLWISYLLHVITGVYLMERAVLFFWVLATAVFVCEAYQQLTGEHIVALFNLRYTGVEVEELEDDM